MAYSLRSLNHQPTQTPPPPPPSPPHGRPLTFLDLPRSIRDRVYHSVLHDSAPQSPDPIEDQDTPPHVPVAEFGLLCASCQVYEEASEVLYRTVHLGSDARLARSFLDFMGPSRRRQIRNLTVFYKCHGSCELMRTSHNWIPVFNLLWESWACVHQVDIHFAPLEASVDRDGAVTARKRCLFEWDETADRFWRGLGAFTTAREIRFLNPVPEYFVQQQAWELGWRVEGHTIDDHHAARALPLGPFVGKLVNPTYPEEANWVHERNQLADQGLDIADKPPSSQRKATQTVVGDTAPKLHFFDLPLEIRTMIYEEVCTDWAFKPYWPTQPARWSQGLGLVLVCKRIWEEAWPFMFKKVRISGGSPLGGIERIGPGIRHTKVVDIHFSCFCPSGPVNLRLNNETIFAREDPVWTYPRGTRSFTHWQPSAASINTYKNEWTETMNRIKSQPNIREVSTTFISCCRRPATNENWMPYARTRTPMADNWKSCCLDLEGHFTSLLATCRNVDTVTLRGNVPPSLALRLEHPDTGLGLPVQAVSKEMAAFIKGAEKETAERDPADPSWAKKTPYPPLRYHPAKTPPPHFVLGRTRPATATWPWLEERGKGDETATGMEFVSGPLFSGTWEQASAVLDFKNVVVRDDSSEVACCCRCCLRLPSGGVAA